MVNDDFNFSIRKNNFEVKLANSLDELQQIQQLRYTVFCEEQGANFNDEIRKTQRIVDKFDDYSDHIIVLDHQGKKNQLVGSYLLYSCTAIVKVRTTLDDSRVRVTKSRH